MTLLDVTTAFSTDERCREFLERLRWPNGVCCPRCQNANTPYLENDKRFWCAECDYQFSVLSGTVFHDTHLPLLKWFTAALLICESRKGMSANQLKRMLGVSYKTAWYLCHRIRHAMNESQPTSLSGVVEVDETYLGARRIRGHWSGRKHGRGAPGKQIVIGIRERDGDLRFVHVKEVTAKTIRETVLDHVSPDAELIVTDELSVYPKALKETYGRRHKRIKHTKEYVNGIVHTNTVESAFSLFKRGVVGTWHRVSAKHLASYLNEMTFRFNRRKNSQLFAETLRYMVTADPLTFEKLTA